MSKYYICDRCGEDKITSLNKYAIQIDTDFFDPYGLNGKIDLCISCAKKFRQFMKSKDNTDES